MLSQLDLERESPSLKPGKSGYREWELVPGQETAALPLNGAVQYQIFFGQDEKRCPSIFLMVSLNAPPRFIVADQYGKRLLVKDLEVNKDKQLITIGNGSPNVVQLDDVRIDRSHCLITVLRRKGKHSVQCADRGSRRGTLIREIRLDLGKK